ncbi:MAG: type VI secretion system contractile sheath large subunit [Candidatus Contendobacter sp.]|nr:type VI secretion system contractile sheath large subunit [Candidatus Contendobacter sp.]MDG4555916.1 type VI secretion system contractile sheath large subunit [Candidatus Contendobacter sp.]
MPGRMEFELNLPQSAPRPTRRNPAAPPRILIMADFSGRGQREPSAAAPDLASRSPLAVDADRFNAVMARLEPTLRLPLAAGADFTVRFAQLDDFHPDALYRRLEPFQALRHARARLLDPAHFTQAAAELAPLAAPEPVHSEPPTPAEGDAALLERLLGRAPAASPTARPVEAGTNVIQNWLRTLVEPHIVRTDPRQSAWVAAMDTAIGDQMRAILHHPAFQALEATWRGVHGLVANLDDDAARVFLLDVTRQELFLDLRAASGKPQATGLHSLLIEHGVRMPDGEPWTLLVGDYAFGAAPEDIALLAALGSLASQAGGPFLAAANPEPLGCDSMAALADPARWPPLPTETEQRWLALRRCEIAPWLGLVLPRVLLRLPYGQKTEPVEAFAFEEMPGGRDPGAYLWGNPALVCARLIAAAFAENGWDFSPGDVLELDDCPAHVYEAAGERAMQPATEVLLSERAMLEILARGPMPLLGHRQRNAIRLARFQSLADPPAALAGAWRS